MTLTLNSQTYSDQSGLTLSSNLTTRMDSDRISDHSGPTRIAWTNWKVPEVSDVAT